LVLLEDEELRQQILAVLRKKERRAVEKSRRDRMASSGSEGSRRDRITSTGSEGSVGMGEQASSRSRRKTPPVVVAIEVGVVSGAEDKKKKRLDK
jgi:hypothetical protein